MAVHDGRFIMTASNAPATVAPTDDAIVAVQTEWDGWHRAMVRVADLEEIHWAQPPGAPRPLLHATVSCHRVLSGNVERLCKETPPPHRLLVCLLKRHLSPTVFERLAARADSAARTGCAYKPPAALVRRRRPLFGNSRNGIASR
jgi:hypothetical protein